MKTDKDIENIKEFDRDIMEKEIQERRIKNKIFDESIKEQKSIVYWVIQNISIALILTILVIATKLYKPGVLVIMILVWGLTIASSINAIKFYRQISTRLKDIKDKLKE